MIVYIILILEVSFILWIIFWLTVWSLRIQIIINRKYSSPEFRNPYTDKMDSFILGKKLSEKYIK